MRAETVWDRIRGRIATKLCEQGPDALAYSTAARSWARTSFRWRRIYFSDLIEPPRVHRRL